MTGCLFKVETNVGHVAGMFANKKAAKACRNGYTIKHVTRIHGVVTRKWTQCTATVHRGPAHKCGETGLTRHAQAGGDHWVQVDPNHHEDATFSEGLDRVLDVEHNVREREAAVNALSQVLELTPEEHVRLRDIGRSMGRYAMRTGRTRDGVLVNPEAAPLRDLTTEEVGEVVRRRRERELLLMAYPGHDASLTDDLCRHPDALVEYERREERTRERELRLDHMQAEREGRDWTRDMLRRGGMLPLRRAGITFDLGIRFPIDPTRRTDP